MSKRLTDSITNSYMEAANRMTSKSSREKIVAYVESYDDVFVWRMMLKRFEDETRCFEVMLPSKAGHLERGKKAAIIGLLSSHVGANMIACVDADYDYLMQGATEQSRTMLGNPYIFHTYAYAIENLQCFAPSLHEVCVAATLNDNVPFDFEDFLRQYSIAIFPLFVWSILYYRSPSYKDFTISDFNRIIDTGNISIGQPYDAIRRVKHKVHVCISQLQREHPNAKDDYLKVKEDIKNLGVTPETTYLYVQGHHLFDKIISPLMKKVCDRLIRERQREISMQSQHYTQQRNELACYNHSVQDIQSMLRKNIGFIFADPFRRIQGDLESFVNNRTKAKVRTANSRQPSATSQAATPAPGHSNGGL